MINVIEAANAVVKENAEFGYTAGKLEVANDVWNNHMSPSDRLEILNSIDLEKSSTLEKLRACVKAVSLMF